MLNWLRGLFGLKAGATAPAPPRLRATYDAAATTTDNQRHWVHADGLSARRANSPGVRKLLRDRSRYEVANNSYASGIVSTLANNLVGKGPRLQVRTADEAVNRAVEARWSEWSDAVRLPDKLRTAKRSKTVDGEGIGLLITNPAVPSAVQLDVLLVEAEQMADLFISPVDLHAVDGLRFDDAGNVTEYHFLPHHPGDWWAPPVHPRRVAPHNVLHWFRRDRPGQWRGIPELTPALGLFAQLRRFTQATITAAETAASFAAVLESEAPANTDAAIADPFDTLNIEHGVMTQLPGGMKLSQFRAEHPNGTYETFVWCIIREVARCLHVPLNVALGDSSKSNFSSARLDHIIYRQAVGVEREDCEREWLSPTFASWYHEARLIPGYLPARLPPSLSCAWHWPAWEPIDAKGEADADAARLAAGLTTLADVAGEQGADWRERIRQQVTEESFRRRIQAEADEADGLNAAEGDGNDLRATVGGLQAIAALQTSVYAGQVPREAAIANAMVLFGFTAEEAASLFPDVPPRQTAPDPPAAPVTAAATPAIGGADFDENKVSRADDGKFGSGPGSGGDGKGEEKEEEKGGESKDGGAGKGKETAPADDGAGTADPGGDAPDEADDLDDDELADSRDAEDAERDARREQEDDETQAARDAEDAELDRQDQETADRWAESDERLAETRDAEDAEREAARDAEDAEREAARDEAEQAREKEDADTQQARDAEDEATARARDAELDEVIARRDAAERAYEKSPEYESDSEEQADAKYEAMVRAETREREQLQRRWDKEDAAVEKAREKEDAEVQKKRDREDAARDKEDAAALKAREKEDGETQKKRDREDAAREKLRANEERANDKEREQAEHRRDKEDAERQKQRDREDGAVERARAKQDAARAARASEVEE